MMVNADGSLGSGFKYGETLSVLDHYTYICYITSYTATSSTLEDKTFENQIFFYRREKRQIQIGISWQEM